jgi:predicted metal-dependent HD superfamily phosphohydrolase
MDFTGAKEHIISLLRKELRPDLHYHCVEHTLDVYEATCRLIELERPADVPHDILKTAALWHDAGMLTRYREHEEASVTMVQQILPGYGYSQAEIDSVATLIMITRLPQQAITLSEQILCDADLDYLGREDFFIHSFQLQLEWKVNNIKRTNLSEWLDIQVKFLSEHDYFTKSARKLRCKLKAENLEEIKKMVRW